MCKECGIVANGIEQLMCRTFPNIKPVYPKLFDPNYTPPDDTIYTEYELELIEATENR